VDVGIVWGPLAGYFAPRESAPLTLTPVVPAIDPPAGRFQFAIAMGVRRRDDERRALLERVIEKHRAEIARILDEFGVPTTSGS
jgi:mxaJ protein